MLKNFGESLNKTAQLLWFLFFSAFCVGCKLGKTNLSPGLKQNHTVL